MTEQEQTTNNEDLNRIFTSNEYRLSKIFTPEEEMGIVALLAGVSIEEMLEIAEKEVRLRSLTQQGNGTAISFNEGGDNMEQSDQEGRS